MERSQRGPTQIAGIRKVFDNGKTTEETKREYGTSIVGLYTWRQGYGSMEASALKNGLKSLW